MQRPLVLFVVFYICGIVAAELFIYFPVTASLSVILLCILSPYIIHVINNDGITNNVKNLRQPYVKKLKCGIFAYWLLIVTAVISGFLYMLYVSRVPDTDISKYATGEKLTVIGMVDEPVRFYSKKAVATVNAMKILRGDEWLDVTGRVRLSVYDHDVELGYGDILRFTGRLKEIRGFKNPGLFDYAEYINRDGIRASIGTGKKENISKINAGGNPVLRRLYRWREKIRFSIMRGLSDNASAILQAMVIGAAGELTPGIRDKFTAAGVTHILSISGSHLGFVTFLIFMIVRYSLLYLPYNILLRLSLYITPSKIAAICTFPPVIFYTMISGGEVATVRSLIMALVYMTAILIEREDDAINTLAVAALIVLLLDPQALFDISFQLSYMAVFSMIIVVRRFYKIEDNPVGWKDKYIMRLKLLMLLNLGASISTAPVIAHYYNQVNWVGIISNMVITPYAGFTVLPVGLVTGVLSLFLETNTIPLAWLNELLVGLLYKMVEIFAGLPLSAIYIPSPGVLTIILVYTIMLSLFFFSFRLSKIMFIISASFLVFISGCNVMPGDQTGLLRVTFLDVGQGDSALIEFPDGNTMLIDGGGTFSETFDTGKSVVAPYLWNKGIRKIDYIVASHPQIDHIKGLTYIADKFKIREVWTNGRKMSSSYDFDSMVAHKNIRRVNIHSGTEDRIIGDCKVSFLNPPYNSRTNELNDNDLSIVMRITCNDISFLFTGDIEMKAIRGIVEGGGLMESTVIKVPHHGARGSVEEDFISRVGPSIAVISAGYQNSYHHPSQEAISLYKRTGAAIYRTDVDGAVIVETGDGRMKVRRYEDMVLKEVDFKEPGSIFHSELSNLNKILEGYGYGKL